MEEKTNDSPTSFGVHEDLDRESPFRVGSESRSDLSHRSGDPADNISHYLPSHGSP